MKLKDFKRIINGFGEAYDEADVMVNSGFMEQGFEKSVACVECRLYENGAEIVINPDEPEAAE